MRPLILIIALFSCTTPQPIPPITRTIQTCDTIYQQCPRCGYDEMLILHNNPVIKRAGIKWEKKKYWDVSE